MSNTKKRALIVDDYHTHRTLIADYLEDAGYDVKAFAAPEEIGAELKECDIVVMDVNFGKDRPFTGIDYMIEQIQAGLISPSERTIIFKTQWRKEVVPERLQKIEKYEWWDASEGLEFTELRTILRRSGT